MRIETAGIRLIFRELGLRPPGGLRKITQVGMLSIVDRTQPDVKFGYCRYNGSVSRSF